ncbi:PREDICTED: uncharacterized protein LOC109582928 [Amphimedon queenslandica]|uniref:Uncharacterized protein n=1 Tax=Amphimedon queenslandica TaxID=400682 RepID=A0AAN0J949_AMPQE|nr:PREDICTED: uncharacterized protein LOC109582928 [Amphimedon queenslandica]XP_019853561.1 PREDICTED: uncharacterized protein LOC109582928 [Amphimedon queenslandica]|eukprot:XP_019853560.1 PREDICTED: uncharacterized protein LOC109582928 [Amphimedon queenslandica]
MTGVFEKRVVVNVMSALDFGKKTSNEKFLLAYILRVLLYYTGRAVFDVDTSLSIDNLTIILSNMTGLLPLTKENDTSEDTRSIYIEWEFDSTWYFLGVISMGLRVIILKRTSSFTILAKLASLLFWQN